jgi:hypothetical protein
VRPSAFTSSIDVEELLLHERVEPACRLVEDQERRPVEHGLNQPDLLLVPPREPPHGTVQLGPQPLRQLARVPEILEAPQPGEEPEQPLPVILSSRANSPGRLPTLALTSTLSFLMSRPNTSPRPPVGRKNPRSVLTVVVFPAPLGPRKPKTSPSSTARSTSSMPRTLRP